MKNPYVILTTYEGADWKVLLAEMGLLEVFGELLVYYCSPDSTRKIIRYIVWTYSVNSERHIAGMDWENNKRHNFDHAGLPVDMWESIGLLKDLDVLRTVHRWLEFQEDPLFKQLQTLRDLKMEMQMSSGGLIKKSNGEIDYDQKYKNAQYALELDKMIQQLENQSIQNSSSLKDALRESNFKRRSSTTGPENFSQ